jgi:hypothetical protein
MHLAVLQELLTANDYIVLEQLLDWQFGRVYDDSAGLFSSTVRTYGYTPYNILCIDGNITVRGELP